MSTLRISNIEAKSVPASATIDEKVKITNSSGDPLVFIDGKTSGITTVGINTTDGNITFDANSNVVVTGIITATRFSGQITPTSLEIGSNIKLGNAGVITATSFVGSGANLTSLPTQVTITNNADDRVITGGSGVNLNGEQRLTFNSSNILTATETGTGNGMGGIRAATANAGGNAGYGFMTNSANRFAVTTIGSAGAESLRVYDDNNNAERLRITSAGNVTVGGHTAALSAYNSSQPRLSVYKSSGSGGYLELGGNIPNNGHSSGTILFINNDNSEATSNNANGKILAMQRVENVTSDTNAGDDMGGDLAFHVKPESGSLTEHLRLKSDGNATINDGNLILANGHGIDFSATANTGGGSGASMSSELLDDYEEGSWTPTLTGYTSGNTQTYAAQYGTYTKVGRVVTAHFDVKLSNKGNISGTYVLLQGLPFNHAGSRAGTGSVHFFQHLSSSVSSMALEGGGGIPGSFWLLCVNGTQSTQLSYTPASFISNSTQISGTLVYRVS